MKKFIFSIITIAALFSSCVTDKNVCLPQEQVFENSLFRWKNYEADLSKEDNWCISRSNQWVAFTDYDNHTQYMVNWDGGMGNGDKGDAVLTLIKEDQPPLVYKIGYFNIDSDGTECTINFLTNDKSEGVIHFPL